MVLSVRLHWPVRNFSLLIGTTPVTFFQLVHRFLSPGHELWILHLHLHFSARQAFLMILRDVAFLILTITPWVSGERNDT